MSRYDVHRGANNRVDVNGRGREWERSRAFEGAADYGYGSRAFGQDVDPRAAHHFDHGDAHGHRGRFDHDPSWTGRDPEHDFWGEARHHQRTVGERIGDWLGGRDEDPRATHHHPGIWDKVKGVFVGRGPKGYVRSDERIREDVCERLTYHPGIDAGEIEVVVENAEVTLAGLVEDRRSKRLAEDIVDDVRGVRDVHNQLRVQPSVHRA